MYAIALKAACVGMFFVPSCRAPIVRHPAPRSVPIHRPAPKPKAPARRPARVSQPTRSHSRSRGRR